MNTISYIIYILLNKNIPLETLTIDADKLHEQRIKTWEDNLSSSKLEELKTFITKNADADFLHVLDWLGTFLEETTEISTREQLEFLHIKRKEISLLNKDSFILWSKYLLFLDTKFVKSINNTLRTHIQRYLNEHAKELHEKHLYTLLMTYPHDGTIH